MGDTTKTLSDDDIATRQRRAGPSGGAPGTDSDAHTDADTHVATDSDTAPASHTDQDTSPATD